MLVDWYFLYEAIRSIFEVWILFIFMERQYVREVDTANTKRYEVFSNNRYCIYYVMRSVLRGSWLLVLRGSWLLLLLNEKYLWGINTSFTKRNEEFPGIYCHYTRRYEIFSREGYCMYERKSSTLEGWILLILCNDQYFRGFGTPFTKQYALFLSSEHFSY